MKANAALFSSCTANAEKIFIKDQLERRDYMEVKNHFLNNFGKWDKKENAFVFPYPAEELLARFKNGETPNWKKEFQFFETPPEIIDFVLQLAVPINCRVLEPSAGNGAFARAIREFGDNTVDCIEIHPICQQRLREDGFNPIWDDFLTWPVSSAYDMVIANPPFDGVTWAHHVTKMLQVSREVYVIVPSSYDFRKEKIVEELRQRVYATYDLKNHVASQAFKKSGTLVETKLLQFM